jgi:hypothetical protein
MAQHLIGYSPRSYFENIFDNPISQYKFYQGYIREKGTKNSIDKLAKATTTNLQGKIEYTEEWALRIGSFGSYSTFNEIELPLRERDFIENSQVIQFVDSIPVVSNDLTSYVRPSDLTIKPTDYDSTNAFKTLSETFSENSLKLPHAGYVRLDDVEYTYTSLSAITQTLDNSIFKEGDKFWIGFDGDSNWNVYRYTKQLRYIVGASQSGLTLTFTTNKYHGLSAGDLISVTRMNDGLNKVYLIDDIPNQTQFSVTTETASLIPNNLPNGVIFKFRSVRFTTIDDLADLENLAELNDNELFWVDDSQDEKWGVLKRVDNYDPIEYSAPRNKPGQRFGHRMVKQSTTSTVVVSADQFYDVTGGYGRIYVYESVGDSIRPITNYALNAYIDQYRRSYDPAGFGDNIVHDLTDNLIFVSAPMASYVKLDTSGSVRQARPENSFDTHQKVGLVKISGIWKSVNSANSEIPYLVLVNPETPQHGSRFGSGLLVQNQGITKRLLVGSPGMNADTGEVYRFDVHAVDTTRNLTGITGTNVSIGTTATFNITIQEKSREYLVSINNTGTEYTTATSVSSLITITGELLGGKAPDNNLYITVISTGTNGSIKSFRSSGTSVLKSVTVATTASQAKLPKSGGLMDTVTANSEFGFKITGDLNAERVAVAAPGYNNDTGAVYIFTLQSDVYTWVQTIKGTDSNYTGRIREGDRLGTEVKMSEQGDYLFVSSPNSADGYYRPGLVGVYKWEDTKFNFVQILNNPTRDPDLNFGFAIDANSSATILSVTSQGANLFLNTKFDGGLTTFDGGACLFGDKTKLSGTAYIYNRYKEKFLLAQELFDGSVDEGSYYGDSVLVDDNKVYIGSPGSITNLNHNGSVYMWNEVVPEINSWQIYRQQEELVDVSLIRNSTTIDSLNAVTIDYLDIVDPLKGRIPGLADQEIRYKTVFDPAVYNVGTSTVVVDANSFWGKNQVGELWWDISTTKYIWYEQGDLGYRKNTWGKLFPGVEISVYEWVKSEYLPSQYATLADTNEGLTAGISGQPKFPDDTVYSVTQTFDKQINQFTYSYYFWVKNKTVVPNEKGRKLSAFEVASLLTDPKSYGLKYLEIISKDAVSLVNFKSKLISDRIYLNISFDSMPTDVNKHTEWILIQEDSANSFPPKQIERKLIDSLLGKDSLGNIVPDPALPSRIKYGIEVRPRQSIFVDRKQALKNAIEYTNAVMKENLLRGFISFENLNSKDEIPDPLLGEYDVVFEDIEGKDTIITNKLRTAKLSCEITNGKVTNIIIDDPGYGYIIAPSITILASNDDVKLKSYIDSNGVITNVDIVNPGSRLTYIPKLTVRPFTIIVQVDPDFNNKWSKYEWIDNSWIRIYTQKFDTTRYWNYIDWQSSEFNSLKPVNYTVDEMYETNELVLEPGDYIKVVNPGDNLYMILRKTEDGVIGSFDNNFDILYKEQGTLFIKDSVWDTTTTQLGFDYKTTFDQLLYDESAEIELQNVLIAIKNNIFVDQLKLYWNKLFFKCLKYAFTEQKFLDWAFKTSFINVKNIAGVLDQRSTYRYQDPVWYESYIKEIKPYHTKIRNYQLNYQIGETNNTPWEPSNTYTTDFDLPAIYNRATKSFSVVEQGNSLMSTYPFKSWDDNTGHSIESITLISGGSGYRLTPVVDIIPAYGDTGFGAKAIAYIGLGKVTEIELIAGGSGYKQTPTIILRGGGDVNLETAVAYPNLTNKKVRSNIIQIKFDRTHSKTGSNREVGNLTFTDMFETTGNNYIFDLTWYASTDKRYITVTLDGIIVIETEYSINNFTKISDNSQYGDLYHKKFSQLVLTNVPTRGKVVEITYRKNIEIYSAAERIADFYNPKEGMPGKDLAQLMEGVEFPGVTVDGLQFSYSSFWDVQPFGESSWDDDGTSQVDLDTVIDGGAVTTGTTYENNAWAFTNARGIQPSDIILDGDKFISPYTSHAPEEVIPGQIQENISISVFTKEEQGSPLIVSQSVMIDSTLTSTVVGLRLQPVSTSSVMISFNSKALVYGKDYSLNFVNKTATINTQTTTGIAGITIIGVGGNELISSNVVTASGLTSTSIDSIVNYDDVGSLYVTSNGETLVESSTYGYTISPISTRNRRARVKINGLTTGTNVIQLWFFRSEYKGYSEVKEQIITLTENTSTIVLSQPPGTVGPLHAQAVVELNGLRLIPPDTTYYEVDGIQTVFPIKTDEPNIPGIYDLSRIEVHRNGIKIRGAQDYVLDQINGNIIFNPGYLAEGDVIAITSTINCDYRIEGSLLILSPTVLISQDDIIKIITYTNHDYSNIRTEVFLNSPSTRYRMDRAILNDNYVWVSVGGRPLTNGIDYQILSDGYTIKIHDAYPYVFDGKVVITSFTDVVASKSIGFRIIKDLLGRTHYKRYSELDTTYLDQPLAITDTKIYVVDSSILSTPNPQQNVPGIIYIEGERIEYFTKSDNVLGQIRRGTLGTGVKDNYEVGTPVVDHGQSQTVPYQDTVATWSTITNANTTTYSISGITFNNSVNTQDQVVVLYGGRVLNKNSYITHDYSMAYDSNEHNSDIENPPEFTITKELAGDGYVLNLGFNPNNNVKVRMAKLTGSIWYENGVDTASNGVSLLETNTIPARFLLERQSGLPDKYQYGQT